MAGDMEGRDARPGRGRGASVVKTAAALVIVVAGLKAASTLLVPIFLAALIALALTPLLRRITALGLPPGAAIAAVVLILLVLLGALSGIIGDSVSKFSDSIPTYKARVNQLVDDGARWIDGMGVEIPRKKIKETFDSGALMKLIAQTMQSMLGTLSQLVVILLIVIFMLAESVGLPEKLRLAMGSADADITSFRMAGEKIQQYLSLKTLLSLITGILVAVFTGIVGLDFPVLWGLTAFLFNFIPNIGSIIAAVPACLLALVQFGFGTAGLVAGGYVVINSGIGNVVEPKLLGNRLGLSTLVVILSLIIWNWILGPMGMLLSIPLTMVLKILLESSDDSRFLAVLLGPPPDPATEAGGFE